MAHGKYLVFVEWMSWVTYVSYSYSCKSINGQEACCFRFRYFYQVTNIPAVSRVTNPFPPDTEPSPLTPLTPGVNGCWWSCAVMTLTCNSDLSWCIWPISFCISSLCVSFSCRSSSSSTLLAVLLSRPSKPDPSFKLLISFSLDCHRKKKKKRVSKAEISLYTEYHLPHTN